MNRAPSPLLLEWLPALHSPSIPIAGEVHLWRIEVGASDEKSDLNAVLSADELLRAERFRFDRDRQVYVETRSALRSIVGAYLGCPAEEIVFLYETRGKPLLASTGGIPPLSFNVSHAHPWGMIAIAAPGSCVGVDIERIQPNQDFIEVAELTLGDECAKLLRSLEAELRDIEFCRLWTRYEANLKARGIGIQASTRAKEEFPCISFVPTAGYAGAVAVDSAILQVRAFHWIQTP